MRSHSAVSTRRSPSHTTQLLLSAMTRPGMSRSSLGSGRDGASAKSVERMCRAQVRVSGSTDPDGRLARSCESEAKGSALFATPIMYSPVYLSILVHTYTQTCRSTHMHACMHGCVHTYSYILIIDNLTCINTYIRT